MRSKQLKKSVKSKVSKSTKKLPKNQATRMKSKTSIKYPVLLQVNFSFIKKYFIYTLVVT